MSSCREINIKFFRLLLIIFVFFFLAGFNGFGDLLGNIATQSEYNNVYKKEYKKALKKGMSERDAHRHATKIAEQSAEKKKSLIGGIGDVLSSTGEIDYDSEFAIGQSLALEGFGRYGLPVMNMELQKYVNTVGNAVVRNSSRSDIPYRFVIVKSSLYNAFACPGGIIFLSSALVKSMEDESQLASVLAHEIAHVSHKHALSSIKRAKFFDGVGKITVSTMKGNKGKQFQGLIGNLQTVLFDRGLDKSMEFEADISGMEATYRTGYDPSAFIDVLTMLQNKEYNASKAGSWFSTHPPLDQRIAKCRNQMTLYRDSQNMATVKDRFLKYRAMIP